MGVDFVVIVDNLAEKKQKEVHEFFGGYGKDSGFSEWEIFTFKGKTYAKWNFPKRYFSPAEDPVEWERLRKYLVEVRRFFGNGNVYLTNDLLWSWSELSDENPWSDLPLRLDEIYLEEPDYQQYPHLKDV